MKTLAVTLSYLIYDLICGLFKESQSRQYNPSYREHNWYRSWSCLSKGKERNQTIKIDYFLFFPSTCGLCLVFFYCSLTFLWLFLLIFFQSKYRKQLPFYLQCGSEMVATLWITEISTPFLHMREILKEIGYRDTRVNLLVDVSSKNLRSNISSFNMSTDWNTRDF